MKRGTKVEQFGEKLSAARRAKGYTQEQLAEKLIVSRTNISRWESGKMMPDLDTINRLSQILDCDFFAAEEGSADAQADAAPAPETLSPAQDSPEQISGCDSFTAEESSAGAQADVAPAPETLSPAQDSPEQFEAVCAAPKKHRARKWLLIASGAALICAALLFALSLNGKSTGEKPKANVVITPKDNPTYAINAGEDMFQGGVGWFYEFKFEETAGVPFTIKEYIVTTVTDGGYEFSDYFTGDEIAPYLDGATLHAGEPKTTRGGFPIGPAQGVRVTLNGTDANGNDLSFSGYVELSKEIKD